MLGTRIGEVALTWDYAGMGRWGSCYYTTSV